jgi:hypothetical protein
MTATRILRSERISVRVTEPQKLVLQTLRKALNRHGLRVTESQVVEFLITTNHHFREDPATLAPALTAWRASQEA